MWNTMGSQGVFQMIYQNRCSDLSVMESVLETMEHHFGDDFYNRMMKQGVIKHLLNHPNDLTSNDLSPE